MFTCILCLFTFDPFVFITALKNKTLDVSVAEMVLKALDMFGINKSSHLVYLVLSENLSSTGHLICKRKMKEGAVSHNVLYYQQLSIACYHSMFLC